MTETPERQETAPHDGPPGRPYPHRHPHRVLTWRTAANSAGYLLPHLHEGLSVLDVGCGPGTVTIDLARRVAPGAVVGVDGAEENVVQAAGLAFDQSVRNVRFRVAEPTALPLPDASVDVVHAHQVLHQLADPVAALGEMRRVLRPGGILAARDADYGAVAWYPRLAGLADWLGVYRAVHASTNGSTEAGRALKAWARRAGFDTVTSSASIWCFASSAEREWWGRSWADRVVEADFAAQAIETGVARLADLQRIGDAWRQWAADEDGWFALPHGEIIAVR